MKPDLSWFSSFFLLSFKRSAYQTNVKIKGIKVLSEADKRVQPELNHGQVCAKGSGGGQGGCCWCWRTGSCPCCGTGKEGFTSSPQDWCHCLFAMCCTKSFQMEIWWGSPSSKEIPAWGLAWTFLLLCYFHLVIIICHLHTALLWALPLISPWQSCLRWGWLGTLFAWWLRAGDFVLFFVKFSIFRIASQQQIWMKAVGWVHGVAQWSGSKHPPALVPCFWVSICTCLSYISGSANLTQFLNQISSFAEIQVLSDSQCLPNGSFLPEGKKSQTIWITTPQSLHFKTLFHTYCSSLNCSCFLLWWDSLS